MRLPNLLIGTLIVGLSATTALAASTPSVNWADGSTTVESDNGSLQMTNKVWALFLAEIPDEQTTLAAGDSMATPPQPGQGRGSFKIRKAETTIEGWFWNKRWTYELELAYRDSSGILNHAMLDYDVSGRELFQIRFGQFKVPFGRQELTSSERLQFVNRSIVSEEFEQGEDVGLMLHGLLAHGTLDWRAGAFNGNGKNKDFNDNRNLQYNARLTYQPWGDVRYSESDFEAQDHPLLALALDFEHNDRRGATREVDARRVIFAADLSFKYKGFSLAAEGLYRTLTPEASSGIESYTSPGWWVQTGYFVYGRNVEIAARHAGWDPSTRTPGNTRDETGLAVNLFVRQHMLKVQTDLRMLHDEATGARDYEARVQTVFWF